MVDRVLFPELTPEDLKVASAYALEEFPVGSFMRVGMNCRWGHFGRVNNIGNISAIISVELGSLEEIGGLFTTGHYDSKTFKLLDEKNLKIFYENERVIIGEYDPSSGWDSEERKKFRAWLDFVAELKPNEPILYYPYKYTSYYEWSPSRTFFNHYGAFYGVDHKSFHKVR